MIVCCFVIVVRGYSSLENEVAKAQNAFAPDTVESAGPDIAGVCGWNQGPERV
jgi:hypothetical protein